MVEVKVTSATVGSLVASIGLAILNATVADSSVLGGLPGWLQWIIIVIAPTLITYLSGYAQPSSTSAVSDAFVKGTMRDPNA